MPQATTLVPLGATLALRNGTTTVVHHHPLLRARLRCRRHHIIHRQAYQRCRVFAERAVQLVMARFVRRARPTVACMATSSVVVVVTATSVARTARPVAVMTASLAVRGNVRHRLRRCRCSRPHRRQRHHRRCHCPRRPRPLHRHISRSHHVSLHLEMFRVSARPSMTP